jgi:hypothetical protein
MKIITLQFFLAEIFEGVMQSGSLIVLTKYSSNKNFCFADDSQILPVHITQ